jgi:hypothetical protein
MGCAWLRGIVLLSATAEPIRKKLSARFENWHLPAGWQRAWPMRKTARNRESKPIEFSREITHMQVGQCGNQEAHGDFSFLAAGAGQSAPSLRGLTCHSTDKGVNIDSAPLHICRAGAPPAYAEI